MIEDRAGREVIVQMLEILRHYSDQKHTMTQKEIMARLESDYDIKPDRKTIKRDLNTLIAMLGDEIKYKQRTRGDNDPIITNIYYKCPLDDRELYMLINAVMCSPYVKAGDARNLVERLKKLASIHFKDKLGSIPPVDDAADTNEDYFKNLDELHEAIQGERKVTFNYCRYGTDMKLHPKLTEDGTPKLYRVSPYRVVEVNGRTYLICNTDGKEGVSNYRVDKMKNTNMVLAEPARPSREMPGLTAGLNDLPRYLAEHMNMSFARTVFCKLRFSNSFVNVVVDTFGRRLEILETGPETSVARVKIDKSAMATWALQYPRQVRVLEPKELVDEIRQGFNAGAAAYEN